MFSGLQTDSVTGLKQTGDSVRLLFFNIKLMEQLGKYQIEHKNEFYIKNIMEEILKKGAKLKVKKITKRQIEKARKQIEKESIKTKPLTWEELHTPMTI